MSAGGGRKAIIAAFFANLGISIAKFVAFLFTGSASMAAESVHSLADTGNQALLLLGGSRARRQATEMHPFGYGRERYFWAFVVALVLFSLGSLFSLYEGTGKLRHPHELESETWAIGVLLVAIVLESFSFRTAIVEARHVKGNLSWPQFVRRSKSPELPVVLLEDLGALVGLCIALGGVVLASITHNARWDAAGSLAIGLLLGAIAILLAVEMKSLLIGEAASPDQAEKLRQAMTAGPNVRRVIHMRTQHIGPEELLVGAKVELEAALSFRDVAAEIDAVETRMRAAVPEARVIYVEPDHYRDERTNAPDATAVPDP